MEKVIEILGYRLYAGYLIKNNKIVAYSLSFNRSSLEKHLLSIKRFHKLDADMIFDNNIDRIFNNKLKKLLFEGKNALNVDLTNYKFSEVYAELLTVPYGETITYGELYKKVSKYPIIAILRALKYNPFIIFIPCHRVIKKDGRTGGYTPLGKEFKDSLIKFAKMIKDQRDDTMIKYTKI